jgi:hypothetical protein
MNYTLTNTNKGYGISSCDALISLGTGFSGIPYAKRHWELSNRCDASYRLGHRVIAVFEAIPLLGGLAALIERVIVYVCNHCFKSTQNASLTTKRSSKILDPASIHTGKVDGIVKTIKASATKVSNEPVSIGMHSQTINTEVDEVAFKKYLFSDSQLRPQNKFLLEQTVCLATCPAANVTYHHAILAENDLDTLLTTTLGKEKSKISCVSNWFDYTEPNHFYIDFAHSTTFGGAYRSYGCVQEERMFVEFRTLAVLDFKTKNGIHPCVESYNTEGYRHYPPKAKPSPFIIEAIHRQFDISRTPYGLAFQRATNETIQKGIFQVTEPVPVNIIGLAAVDWRGIANPKYKIEDLIYHFEAAYAANKGAKEVSTQRGWKETVIHTAPWGCGAFLNSEKMMTAIQYLAARMAGVDLVFHGIGNPINPHYTQKNVDQIFAWISNLLDENKCAREILEILLDTSLSDLTWASKRHN